MITDNLMEVQREMAKSIERRVNSLPEPVQLIAVTKNHPVEAMREAIDAGATVIGENRVQEAQQKYETLDRDVTWHLIGHLQTNKVKQAVKIFDVIESVDSLKVATAINKEALNLGKVQSILVQVNLAKEEVKSGIYVEDLEALLMAIDKMPGLKLQGLMFIPPNLDDEAELRSLFARMYQLYKQVETWPLENADLRYLSMGMTHDYQIAIEEGANIVRVGTGIFGQRQY